jgi:hypothetical protein
MQESEPGSAIEFVNTEISMLQALGRGWLQGWAMQRPVNRCCTSPKKLSCTSHALQLLY